MIPNLTPQQIIALLVVTIGAVWDMKTTKIPNLLTYPAMGVGLVLNGWMFGATGAIASLICIVIPIAVAFFVYYVFERKRDKPGIGGGDYKLFAAIGALLANVPDFGIVVFYFCLSFGLLALIQIPWKDGFAMLMSLRNGQVPAIPSSFTSARKKPIQIGPAIALGVWCLVFLEEPTKRFFTGS